MKYCGNCGHPAEDGMKFCPECGAAMPVFKQAQDGQTQSEPHAAPKVIYCGSCGMRMAEGTRNCPMCGAPVEGSGRASRDFRTKKTQRFDQKPTDSENTADSKLLAVLCYLGSLVIFPLLMGRKSPYVRFHLNQGLILTVIRIIVLVMNKFLRNLHFPIIGSLYGFISMFIFISGFIGVINAIQGQMKELPLIGKIQIIK